MSYRNLLCIAVVLGLTSLCGAGCSSGFFTGPVAPTSEYADEDSREGSRATEKEFSFCADAEPPTSEEANEGFRRRGSRVVASSGPPLHRAFDSLMTVDGSSRLRAKLAYGVSSWDLEGETVEVWLDNCSGEYRKLGTTQTDDDGIASLDVDSDPGLSVGAYSVVFRVVGDGSYTRSMLRVLPEQTKFVVFDIDDTVSAEGSWGTIEDLFGIDPEIPRDGAVETSRIRRFDQGYQIVYLSSRHEIMIDHTRNWLSERGFAPGMVVHAPTAGDVPQSDQRAGEFKRRYIEQLQQLGFDVEYAYGNAESDLYAYLEAGLSPEHIFMFGDHFTEVVVLDGDFVEHNRVIRDQERIR